MKQKVILTLSIVIFIFASCSDYQKILKVEDPEKKYEFAVTLYQEKDYTRAIALFEDVLPYFKGKQKAEEVHYYYAYSHYGMGDYILGGHYFRTFASTFPTSKYAEECQFMGAYCYFLDSPRTELDQDNTLNALKELQLFVSRYPNSKHVPECNDLNDRLRRKLHEKSYINAKLYYDLGSYDLRYYKSALVALKGSLKEFPDSQFREELLFLIVKASFMVAKHSYIEIQPERYEKTISEYNIFVAQYPESKHSKEAKRLYDEALKKTKKEI